MRTITNYDISQGQGWCIAGGYAACPGLATDCDVWVFLQGFGGGDAEDFRVQILSNLKEWSSFWGFAFTPEANDPDRPTEFYDLGNDILCWKVAKLDDGRHIILTDARDAAHLLENFDISTHQCALTSDGEFIKGSQWTPIDVPPVMLRDTPNTRDRMQKIEARYGLTS